MHGHLPVGVPAVGALLAQRPGLFPLLDLPPDLVFTRPFKCHKAVKVLDLRDRGLVKSPILVGDVDVDVGLKAHVPHLHLAFADAEVSHDLLQFLPERRHLCPGCQIRLSHDLQ